MNGKKVTVYCASSNEINSKYLKLAGNIGSMLANCGYEIIYGGGKVGMMGCLADSVIAADGFITGIIPEFMIPLELAHNGLNKLQIVENMHQRQYKMMIESDCILALPGGCGTILELIEAITWKRLGLLLKPVIILNYQGYYNELLEMLEKSIYEKFMNKEFKETWLVAETTEEAVEMLNSEC